MKRKTEPLTPVPQPEAPFDTATRSTLTSFAAIVDRVETVIDSETEALTHSRPIDLGLVNRQKRQGLLELSRIMRAVAGTNTDDATRSRLDRLSVKLENNRVMLDRHLRAVREVADIIALSIQEAESDGTYSRPVGRR